MGRSSFRGYRHHWNAGAPGAAGRIDATSNSILPSRAFCSAGMCCDGRDAGCGADCARIDGGSIRLRWQRGMLRKQSDCTRYPMKSGGDAGPALVSSKTSSFCEGFTTMTQSCWICSGFLDCGNGLNLNAMGHVKKSLQRLIKTAIRRVQS